MSVSGLAEGFLAGFNTMDRYQRGQKDDARRDEVWQNEKERQSLADARYEQESDHLLEREKLTDTRYEDETKYNRGRQDKIDARQEKIDTHNMNLANSREGRERQVHTRQMQEFDTKQYLSDNMGIIQAGWDAISRGEDPGTTFLGVVNDKRAANYNPQKYIKSEFANASKVFVNHTSALMKQVEAGTFDPSSPEGHAAINSQEFVAAGNVLFQEEVNRGVGDIDPASGKVIKAKKLNNIMVTPDGKGLVLGVAVTYDDGSTAIKPVTEGRSSDPKDPPKVIPIMDYVGMGFKRAALSKQMIASADRMQVNLGLTSAPDSKGYRTAMANLEKDYLKNRTDLAKSDIEDRDAQLADLDTRYEQSKQQLAQTYGLGDTREDGPAPTPVLKAFVGNDQDRLEFVQAAYQSGKLPILEGSPQAMENAFTLWKVAKDKKLAEDNAASVEEGIVNGGGDAGDGKKQPHNYRATEEAFLKRFAEGPAPKQDLDPEVAKNAYMALSQARR